jgi:hypothetical protein
LGEKTGFNSVLKDVYRACYSERSWALGSPEAMKVERQTLATENGASLQKRRQLSIFSPSDFQESACFFPNYRNFDPRVSSAWSPARLHDRTVIRVGYGIYSGAGQNDDLC